MKSWAMGISSALALAVASQAMAETVTVNYLAHPSPGLSSSLYVDFSGNTPNSYDQTAVGAFKWQVTAVSGGSTFTVGQNIYTFCLQASQGIASGTTYTVSSLSGSPVGGTEAGYIDALAAAQIQGLVSQFSSALDYTSSNGTGYTFNSNSYSDNEVAAAFQLAVWEIEYDGGQGGEAYGSATNYFTSGTLRASAGTSSGTNAINLAKGWLNAITADNSGTSIALTNASKQDQLIGIATPGGGTPRPVPLPAAFPASLVVLGGLGAWRKWCRKA